MAAINIYGFPLGTFQQLDVAAIAEHVTRVSNQQVAVQLALSSAKVSLHEKHLDRFDLNQVPFRDERAVWLYRDVHSLVSCDSFRHRA